MLNRLLACASLLCAVWVNAEPTVLILRFEQIDTSPGLAWVGRAVQQSLATDLNRSKVVSAELLPETRSVGTTDTTVARQLGQEQQADYVVVGGYQAWDNGLRITAQVINVSSGETTGSLKSTGQLQGLFLMQDALAGQLRQIVAPNQAVKITVPAEQLTIPTYKPIGVATIKPLAIEIPVKESWRENARNRHNLLAPAGFPWCGWPGWWGCGFFGIRGGVGPPVNGIGW